MPSLLSKTQLEQLRQISTPTLSNAIEVFQIRPRSEGFMSPQIRCFFPELGPMVGYAVTGRIRAKEPPQGYSAIPREEWWEYILSQPSPRVVVLEDLDGYPPVGSFWGEVNGNIHKALGCVGTVTNGGVRDLEEVRSLGFHFFAAAPLVSHAYVHLVDYGQPVQVGGITVHPGDLLHADRHGVLLIPLEIANQLLSAVKEVEQRERILIDYCKSPGFSLEGLKNLWKATR